jgi:uncharacterized CHY-type Zn-finger protein
MNPKDNSENYTCLKCGAECKDTNFKKFGGNPLSKRVYCNGCVDEMTTQ